MARQTYSRGSGTCEEGTKMSKELRTLMAKKEEASAKMNMAAAEIAKQRAEIAKLNAEMLRADVEGVLPISRIARW